ATMTLLGGAVNLQTLSAGTSLDLVNTTYNGTAARWRALAKGCAAAVLALSCCDLGASIAAMSPWGVRMTVSPATASAAVHNRA
ncbi:hypothetical protein AB4084_40000, partial [Lysobacter sp. 2RAB21]